MTQVIHDTTIVSDLAAQVMQEQAKVVTTVPPSASEVELPGGFITTGGSLVKYAEIRELNGADEEAIAKSGSKSRALSAILQRGLVSIGGSPVQPADFDELLYGDREAILLAIRKITFGDTVPVTSSCVNCGTKNVFNVDLNDDVPVKVLVDPIRDRIFEVKLKKSVALVALPNGITQKKILDNLDKTSSELITLIISGCLMSIDGAPSMGRETALSLGMADRETLTVAINENNPGPRLGGVFKVCEACGNSVSIPLGLADLFRI